MRTTKSIVTSLVLTLVVAAPALAQTSAKVIAVINKASWCSVCQKNGERAMSVFMNNKKDGAVQYVVNDLSNDDTKSKSAAMLKEVGLDKAMSEFNGTGMVYFFDASSKKLISKISIVESNDELVKAIENTMPSGCSK